MGSPLRRRGFPSSFITSCRSSQALFFSGGFRSRYAGWKVGMSFTPSYSRQLPRCRVMGVGSRSSVCTAKRPSATTTFGPIARDLRLEEGLAGGDLVGLRVAVPRRAALHHVRDVDLLAPEAHRLDHLREELPGLADEGLALRVLVGARPLAHEHELRPRVADPEHEGRAAACELAARALADVAARRASSASEPQPLSAREVAGRGRPRPPSPPRGRGRGPRGACLRGSPRVPGRGLGVRAVRDLLHRPVSRSQSHMRSRVGQRFRHSRRPCGGPCVVAHLHSRFSPLLAAGALSRTRPPVNERTPPRLLSAAALALAALAILVVPAPAHAWGPSRT